MLVNCFVIKELFNNKENGYRVLSCLDESKNKGLIVNKYGNFTLSGYNLNSFQINHSYEIEIEEDKDSKYAASYKLSRFKFANLENGKIKVDEDKELNILSSFMSDTQASTIHQVYPNFISLILNNKEKEIDVKKIKGVGKKRLSDYTSKIKENLNFILLYPLLEKYGIKEKKDVEVLLTIYGNNILEIEKDINKNPYNIYIDKLNYSFLKADKLVKNIFPVFIKSKERCERYCIYTLKLNELNGNTRMKANQLAHEIYNAAPELIDFLLEVSNNSIYLYYEKNTKWISLRRTYENEKIISESIKDRVKNKNISSFYWEEFTKIDNIDLTEEQIKLLQFAHENILILTGAAGTGKSQSVKSLTCLLTQNNINFQLLTPTGISAKVLSKYTGHRALTIHKFLTMINDINLDDIDYILIDEFSMVSVNLFASLLKVINKKTKIILICDPYQLPSIECGNITHDILQSNVLTNINLTKVFRYNTSGLITIATDTRHGISKNLTKEYIDYKFIEIDKEEPEKQILNVYDKLLTRYNQDDIIILSPYNVGNIGTLVLNNLIQEKYNSNNFIEDIQLIKRQVKIYFKIGDRVINKKNNYKIPVVEQVKNGWKETGKVTFICNGSLGFILDSYIVDNKKCLIVQFDNDIVLFDSSNIKNLLLGYSISVHSSQGTQAKAVIVCIDQQHSNLLNRNLDYVAFTRSQENLIVIGDKEVVEESIKIEETNQRQTWLKEMLLN